MELAVIHVLTERCADLEAQLQRYRDVYDVRFVRDSDGTYYLLQHRRRIRIENTKLCIWVEPRNPHPNEKTRIRIYNSSIMYAELGALGKLGKHIARCVCELRFGDPEDRAVIFPSDMDEGMFYLRTGASVDPILEDNAREIFRSIAAHCPANVSVYD